MCGMVMFGGRSVVFSPGEVLLSSVTVVASVAVVVACLLPVELGCFGKGAALVRAVVVDGLGPFVVGDVLVSSAGTPFS